MEETEDFETEDRRKEDETSHFLSSVWERSGLLSSVLFSNQFGVTMRRTKRGAVPVRV
jgi:hypothetical protein